MISVIIPVGRIDKILSETRRRLSQVQHPLEVLLVGDQNTIQHLKQEHPAEKVLYTTKVGRGYACALGARNASGSTLVFLHSDTILPQDWYETVQDALKDTKISGGGFSLSF